MTPAVARAAWTRALEEEIGIGIEITETDRKALTALLYKIRAEMADPDLEIISLIQPNRQPPEIWLIKRTVELDP